MKRALSILTVTAAFFLLASALMAQSPWIHVEVDEGGDGDTHVNVNLPLSVVQVALEAAPEKIIEDGQLHLGHVDHDLEIEDLRRMWEELRNAGDAEFVSVEGDDENVKIRREGDFIRIDVDERGTDSSDEVHIEVPVTVVDALFSGEGDELNIERALQELSSQRGDIVRVDDGETKVRIWIDEKD